MPTYDYECTRCGHTFEKYQKMSAPPLKRCPVCRCKVRRLIGTGAGLLFKGSGFYTTDYRSEGYQQAKKKEESPPASPDAKGTSSKGKKKPPSSSSPEK